jgi:mannose/cellobiose epimerase-like protein (N-acyl-D-glucosamine 2-epimerase family)
MLNHPNRAAALHVEAADGRVLSLVVRVGRLRLRGDLANEDAVKLVMETVDFALRPAPGAAIFSVTVDGRTSEVRRSDGHLVYSGDLPTSLPVRLFMASVAEAIEARFGASMCGAIALDGRRVRPCQRWPHREQLSEGTK